MRQNHYDILSTIKKNLIEKGNGECISPEYMQEIDENMVKKYGKQYDPNGGPGYPNGIVPNPQGSNNNTSANPIQTPSTETQATPVIPRLPTTQNHQVSPLITPGIIQSQAVRMPPPQVEKPRFPAAQNDQLEFPACPAKYEQREQQSAFDQKMMHHNKISMDDFNQNNVNSTNKNLSMHINSPQRQGKFNELGQNQINPEHKGRPGLGNPMNIGNVMAQDGGEYPFNLGKDPKEIAQMGGDMNNIFNDTTEADKQAEIQANSWDNQNLNQQIEKTFKQLESEIEGITDEIRNKMKFALNTLDDSKFSEIIKDLQQKVENPNVSNWLGLHIVWMRVPKEHRYHELYKNLVLKLNKKDMIKKVIADSFKLANLAMDFGYNKTNLDPIERTTMRHCGLWIGIISIARNKPILQKDFDIKQRLYMSTENRTISATVPIVCAILKSIEHSTIFKSNNPYIMGVLGVLIEISNDQNVKETVKANIESLFKDLKIKPGDIKHFFYIEKKRSLKQSKNKFFINCLPNYIAIDSKTLGPFLHEKEAELRQLVAVAVDLAVKEITKPVLQRSVNIALFTTRELALKDFGLEHDEMKLINATQVMVTNLAGNLALVTCREPLRVHIRDNLEALLDAQTVLDAHSKETIKEIASQDNLDLACAIVKKFVIDKAIDEVTKDHLIKEAINKRKMAKERNDRYIDENIFKVVQRLPPILRPNIHKPNRENVDIYENFASNVMMNSDFSTVGNLRKYHPHIYNRNMLEANLRRDERVGKMELDEAQIHQILVQLKKEISNQNTEEKARAIHMIYGNLSRLLQSTQNIESKIFNLAKMVLQNLFTSEINDKLIYYSDVLVIYSNYNTKLPKDITEWIFSIDENDRYKSQIIIVFLRRNLLHVADFDTKYAEVLDSMKPEVILPLNCIITILKTLVIEERIFTIFTFKKIIEQIKGFYKTDIYNMLTNEYTIFIDNLIQYLKQTNYITSIKFRLTNLELEYNKLIKDVEDYFKRPDEEFYHVTVKFLNKWLNSQTEAELSNFINEFEQQIARGSDKTTISFFCYIFDISIRKVYRGLSLDKNIPFRNDYTYIDLVAKMITILLKTLINYDVSNKTNLLEKILTGLIIVLTKNHHINPQGFDQKPFFRLLFNILYVNIFFDYWGLMGIIRT